MNLPIHPKKKASFIQSISTRIRHEIKVLERKKMILKIKVVLLVVLPVLIVLIAIKALKTYARIRIRQAAMSHVHKPSEAEDL